MRKSCGERMCSNYLHVFEDTLAFLVALFEALLCWRLFFCRGELLKEETVLSKGTLLDELNPSLMNFLRGSSLWGAGLCEVLPMNTLW